MLGKHKARLKNTRQGLKTEDSIVVTDTHTVLIFVYESVVCRL